MQPVILLLRNRLKSVKIVVNIVLTIIVSIMVYPLMPLYSSAQVLQLTGKIRGRINVAIVPGKLKGPVIIIEGGQIVRKVMADTQGNYEIELPVGIYQITTEDLYGYFPFRRAAFQVRSGTDNLINILPVARAVSYGDVSPRFYYESFLTPTTGIPLDLLIRYGKRNIRKGIVEYSGVMVSYNLLTIYADKLQLDPKSFWLEAEGNVVVEDGKQSVLVKRAEVRLEQGDPVITLTRGVINTVKGEGSINGGTVVFKFDVKRDGLGYLTCEDKKRSIRFVSVGIDSFRVIDDTRNTVILNGRGHLSGNVPSNYTLNGRIPVSFTATLQDKSAFGVGKDIFSIDFNLDNFRVAGTLSQGDIEVHRDY